jgi:hypothetical protein
MNRAIHFNKASNLSLAIVSRSGARRQGQQDTGGLGVLMWCTVLWRTSRRTPKGRVSSGNSAKSRLLKLYPNGIHIREPLGCRLGWSGQGHDPGQDPLVAAVCQKAVIS